MSDEVWSLIQNALVGSTGAIVFYFLQRHFGQKDRVQLEREKSRLNAASQWRMRRTDTLEQASGLLGEMVYLTEQIVCKHGGHESFVEDFYEKRIKLGRLLYERAAYLSAIEFDSLKSFKEKMFLCQHLYRQISSYRENPALAVGRQERIMNLQQQAGHDLPTYFRDKILVLVRGGLEKFSFEETPDSKEQLENKREPPALPAPAVSTALSSSDDA